jgi:hypothetical protein
MTRFYLLRVDSDPSVIGVGDTESQSEIVKDKFINEDNYNLLIKVLGSNEYWLYKDSLFEQPIAIERVELSQQAILTDVLQFSPALVNCPFLLSKRVKGVFESCNDMMFFETSVFNNDCKHTYYLPHIYRLGDHLIDYEKSTFFIGDDLLGKQYVDFSSAEEKQNFGQDNFDLSADTLFIKEGENFNLDLFCLGDGELVISESVKNKLDNIGATGFVALPAFGNDLKWPRIMVSGKPNGHL